MALTLERRKTLKNGGASYGIPGVRSSAYFAPKMFVNGSAPAVIVINTPEGVFAAADQAQLEREKKKVARAANREATKTQREGLKTARAEARKLREAARDLLKSARAAAKSGTDAETEEMKKAAMASVGA